MIKTGIRYGKDSEIKSVIKDAMEDIRIYKRKRARRFNSFRY
jgi:hypothetical protein